MSARVPRFVPILSTYATRVSGRSVQELIQSPAGLARALADTQQLVGHDAVLCFYAPELLVKSCMKASGVLCDADEVPRSGSIAAVFEAVSTLRNFLPAGVQVFASFPGPGFMLGELRRMSTSNLPELSDYDYVTDVFLSLVRSACELGGRGIAIAEDVVVEEPVPESCYRSARKLVDFYSARMLVFLESGSDEASAFSVADTIFRLPREPDTLELLAGVTRNYPGEKPAMTTNMDVPVDVPVEDLRALRALAME
jgi:hypothetical protein